MAALSNVQPIIAAAGREIVFVETLIDRSGGDTIIDYHEGDEAVVEGLKTALGNEEPQFASDAVSEHNTILNIYKVINKTGGKIAVVLATQVDSVPEALIISVAETCQVDLGKEGSKGQRVGIPLFTSVMLKFLGRVPNEGWLRSHFDETVPARLYGLEDALTRLKNGSVSARKLFVGIPDTYGLDPLV